MKNNALMFKGKRKNYIKPDRFFSTEGEKTKLNWILYEYALEIESYIQHTKRLKRRLLAKGLKSVHIADFCGQFSKTMKPRILDKVDGRVQNVVIDRQVIERILPEIGETLANQVLKLAVTAWTHQMESCLTCPQRCMTDWNARAPMFEDPYYYE